MGKTADSRRSARGWGLSVRYNGEQVIFQEAGGGAMRLQMCGVDQDPLRLADLYGLRKRPVKSQPIHINQIVPGRPLMTRLD
jgi:hypothetical protein